MLQTLENAAGERLAIDGAIARAKRHQAPDAVGVSAGG